jgi:RHS repeat-associated protein
MLIPKGTFENPVDQWTAETLASLLPNLEATKRPSEFGHFAALGQLTGTLKKNLSAKIAEDPLGVLTFPFEAVDTVIAFATDCIARYLPAQCAATTGSLHLGSPHLHSHPPANPSPLPGFGALLTGCQSVRIGVAGAARIDLPAARAGDLGLAISCGTITPPFQISCGSSSVFIGGARAARQFDPTNHCSPPKGKFEVGKALGFGAVSLLGGVDKALTANARAQEVRDGDPAAIQAENAGHALNAKAQAMQAVMDALALALQFAMGCDKACTYSDGVVLWGKPSVLIGGLSIPPSTDLVVKNVKDLGKLKDVARAAKAVSLIKRAVRGIPAKGRTRNSLPADLVRLTGHPVDVLGGSFVLDVVDAELPGALPVVFARHYSSTWGSRPSPVGHGWSHSYDEAVWREPGELVYRGADGRELEFPAFDREHFSPRHRLTLRALGEGRWQIVDERGLVRDFAPIGPPVPGAPDGLARLVRLADRAGHRLDLDYDEHARLVAVRAVDGRELRLRYHPDGHLAQLDLPDPDQPGFVAHVRYGYAGDDLCAVEDALGNVTRYRHDNHKIVEETLPNGLRFHFEYDDIDTDARCIRTHGDGGIIDHTLVHDRARRTTLVTNACREICIYRAGGHDEPLEITDARGGTTRYEYDEHLRLVAETDPLGHVTRHAYDARGNRTRTVAPDGGVTSVEYDARDLPVAATDPAGGRWRWSYDAHGRLVRRTDPLGRTTTYTHEPGPASTTVTVHHPDGRRDRHTRDLAGRPVRVERSDGSEHHFVHDRRGRLVGTTDRRGGCERRAYDLAGRLVRLDLPGGDVRHFGYDALGCLVRACDGRRDLRCTYTGLRWLATCGDASAPPLTLERDLEGRLLRVGGPTGTLWQAERDAVGRVRTHTDALGVTRRFTRDLAGRIVDVAHPGGQRVRVERDPAGRVVRVDHGDGAVDEFAYRADGPLMTAIRRAEDGVTIEVRRERDAAGRIVREWQDDHWVALAYDLRDRPTHLRSSRGADLRLHHDDRGLARVGVPGDAWEIRFERDPTGREQARDLPGGVTSWWHRDALGRPLEHGVTGSRPPQIHRHRRFEWTADHRLAGEVDLTAPAAPRPRRAPAPPPPPPAPTHTYDPRGRRIATTHPDGSTWRYRWARSGELLAVTAPDGRTHQFRHDALGRLVLRETTPPRDPKYARTCPEGQVIPPSPAATRWQWLGDVPLHTAAPDAAPVTWVFEPGTFTPLARLCGPDRHAVVSDPFGAPLAVFDGRGAAVLGFEPAPARLLARGDASLCPFRLPGQLADEPTGLCLHRFRVYDPDAGQFLTPDPLGLVGGLDPYAFVADPRSETDVFGLRAAPVVPDEFAALTRAPTTPATLTALLTAELAEDLEAATLSPALAEVLTRPLDLPDRLLEVSAALRGE